MSVTVVRTRSELDAALASWRAAGPSEARGIALVPTMGGLHEAHATLVTRAAELADVVVVSVFVNPLQFGPGEDLDRYPRSFDDDVRLLERAAAATPAVVFAPSVDEMYPGGQPQVRVSAGPLGAVLEGASRPGHFDGVLTVVLKLFGIVRPDVAVFGAKDAQQLALVQRMVRDLDVRVRIEPHAVVRASDGLALSTRNAYLVGEARTQAVALSAALAAGGVTADAGASADEVRASVADLLQASPGVTVDYVALVDPDTFGPVDGPDGLLLVAATVGTTRLIDNTQVRLHVPAPVLAPVDQPGGDA